MRRTLKRFAITNPHPKSRSVWIARHSRALVASANKEIGISSRTGTKPGTGKGALSQPMARPLRFQFPGAVYHPPSPRLPPSLKLRRTGRRTGVASPGNHGQEIFRDDQDRHRWLATLGEACAKTGWRVPAFVLMELAEHLESAGRGRRRESHSGVARQAHDKAAAEAALARWLRRRTAVTLRWVGERLDMGHYTRVTQAVSRVERRPGRKAAHLRDRLRQLDTLEAT